MTIQTTARLAGLSYFALILSGIFGLVYVPATLFNWADASATVANIQANMMLFRFGVLGIVICFGCYLALPLLLYRIFHSTSRAWSVAMVALALVSIPSTFTITGKYLDVLMLISNQLYLGAIPVEQMHALVMFNLASFNNAILIFNIFWGAWLLPFGYLIIKSKLFPTVIGYMLVIGAVSYVLQFLLKFLFSVESLPWYVGLSASLGEFAICLWMMIMGTKKQFNSPL